MPKALIDSTPDLRPRNQSALGPTSSSNGRPEAKSFWSRTTPTGRLASPTFTNAVFKIVPDGTTRVAGLKSGDLTMIRDIPPDQLSIVKALPDIKFQEVVGFTSNQIFLVNNKPPFDDIKVREAVSKAINYDEIMTNLVAIPACARFRRPYRRECRAAPNPS